MVQHREEVEKVLKTLPKNEHVYLEGYLNGEDHEINRVLFVEDVISLV